MPSTAISGQRSRARPNLELIGLRINAGLSRTELAARIGVGKETIRKAEAGFVPSERVQSLLAKQFRLTSLDLWPIERQRRPLPPLRKEIAA
jgi:DNA-binding XRE family transcriptional regulator